MIAIQLIYLHLSFSEKDPLIHFFTPSTPINEDNEASANILVKNVVLKGIEVEFRTIKTSNVNQALKYSRIYPKCIFLLSLDIETLSNNYYCALTEELEILRKHLSPNHVPILALRMGELKFGIDKETAWKVQNALEFKDRIRYVAANEGLMKRIFSTLAVWSIISKNEDLESLCLDFSFCTKAKRSVWMLIFYKKIKGKLEAICSEEFPKGYLSDPICLEESQFFLATIEQQLHRVDIVNYVEDLRKADPLFLLKRLFEIRKEYCPKLDELKKE